MEPMLEPCLGTDSEDRGAQGLEGLRTLGRPHGAVSISVGECKRGEQTERAFSSSSEVRSHACVAFHVVV